MHAVVAGAVVEAALLEATLRLPGVVEEAVVLVEA